MLIRHGSTGNIVFEVYSNKNGNIKLYIGGEGGVSGSKYDVSSCHLLPAFKLETCLTN